MVKTKNNFEKLFTFRAWYGIISLRNRVMLQAAVFTFANQEDNYEEIYYSDDCSNDYGFFKRICICRLC